MAKRPSETAQGMSWMANFSPHEAIAARQLLDSLQVVSETAFRVELTAHLVERLTEITYPVAVLPIREVPKQQTDVAPPAGEADVMPVGPAALTAPYKALPGSEGIVGNIIRNALKAASAKPWQLDPALETMRARRVRSLVFVDDYGASGERVEKYISSWTAHPTVRSWHSYGLIRIHVVLFAVSERALDRLSGNKWISSVSAARRAPDFSTALWSPEERDRIERLCRDHARTEKWALGFEGVSGLLAFQHTIPNNLPSILWQRKGPDESPFTPMFVEQQMTAEQQEAVADYVPPTSAGDIARSLERQHLAEALDQQPGANTRLVLQVLMAVERGARDSGRLSATLMLPVAAAAQIVAACRQLGLLDEKTRLTDHGRSELAATHGRVQLPSQIWRLNENDSPYYPGELREAGGV